MSLIYIDTMATTFTLNVADIEYMRSRSELTIYQVGYCLDNLKRFAEELCTKPNDLERFKQFYFNAGRLSQIIFEYDARAKVPRGKLFWQWIKDYNWNDDNGKVFVEFKQMIPIPDPEL